MKTTRIKTALLCALTLTAGFSAALYADVFGSGANAFNIDFVTIGNPGNGDDRAFDDINDTPADPNDDEYASPYGGVAYTYRMGVTEVPQDWIVKATNLGLTNVTTQPWSGSQPAAGISWSEAAQFVNWLNTSTGHHVAYDVFFTPRGGALLPWSSAEAWDDDPGPGFNPNFFRHKDAYYFLPSEDEWYKAAYHKNDGVTANYWDYATGSNKIPTAVNGGTTPGTVVYNLGSFASLPNLVFYDGGLSPYGTRGQNGNVFEWMESAADGINDVGGEDRVSRGGAWIPGEDQLRPSYRIVLPPGNVQGDEFGFRIASVPVAIPEPSAAVLMIASSWLVLARRRR